MESKNKVSIVFHSQKFFCTPEIPVRSPEDNLKTFVQRVVYTSYEYF